MRIRGSRRLSCGPGGARSRHQAAQCGDSAIVFAVILTPRCTTLPAAIASPTDTPKHRWTTTRRRDHCLRPPAPQAPLPRMRGDRWLPPPGTSSWITPYGRRARLRERDTSMAAMRLTTRSGPPGEAGLLVGWCFETQHQRLGRRRSRSAIPGRVTLRTHAEDVPRPAGVDDTDGLGYLPDEDFATTRAEDQSPIGSQRYGPRARQPSCGPGVDRADGR